MKKLALCLLFAACTGGPEGVTGQFESVRYETVHVGDTVAARFTTADGRPITTTFEEGAMPAGWDVERAGTIDPNAYASTIARAVVQLRDELDVDDSAALARAAAPLGKQAEAYGSRTWYASCVPSRTGGEEASLPLKNGGNATTQLRMTKQYGTRAGSLYNITYYVSVRPGYYHVATLTVSNGANIIAFYYGADPIDYIYRWDPRDRCW